MQTLEHAFTTIEHYKFPKVNIYLSTMCGKTELKPKISNKNKKKENRALHDLKLKHAVLNSSHTTNILK